MSVASVASNPFVEFVARYGGDAELFVREVLGVDPDPWQLAVLRDVSRGEKRISIRSGHGVGKTALLSWIIVWHATLKFPQKTVATAASAPQLFDALVPEVKMWMGKLPEMVRSLFTVQAEGIFLTAAPDESFISFRTSKAETPEAMAGVHSDNVLLVFDEASGIPEPVFHAAQGSMSGHSAISLMAGNPVRRQGTFHDSQTKLQGLWTCYHVSCEASSRVSKDQIESFERQYGRDSNVFRVRILGEFPLSDDDTVIPFDLAEASLQRDVKPWAVKPIWGIDLAGQGKDRTAVAKRRGNVLMQKVQAWNGLNDMQTVGRIYNMWKDTIESEQPEDICVDAIGMGSPMAHRLQELGLPIRAINVGESSSLEDRYANLKAELWFQAREWFETKQCNLANDADLMGELIQTEYAPASDGRLKLKPKKDTHTRSPDLADAFVLTFAVPSISASGQVPGGKRLPSPRRRIPGLT